MRINLHDFSGHPFQVQLSRELAARGHEVVHNFCPQYVTGRGRLSVTPDDPAGLRIESVVSRHPMAKYSPLGRLRFELGYASAWQRRLAGEDFDVVVACNVPLFTLAGVHRHFRSTGQRWVLWHQDVYSLGVGSELERLLPAPLVTSARSRVESLERAQVRGADAVVAITEEMVQQYRSWGIERERVHVIPNWAPLDDITPAHRDNPWARAQQLRPDRFRLVYAGTLGRKHNPLLLLDVLDELARRGVPAECVVASEGVGAEDLRAAAAGRDDVRIVGFQPVEAMSDMLASADVVLALLEPDAARFSVPSKVLTYLCAGRPIVALMPEGNPAAHDVLDSGGYVGPPTATGARLAAEWMSQMRHSGGSLDEIGRRSRALAESRFDIGRIAQRFEAVLHEVVSGPATTPRTVAGVAADGALGESLPLSGAAAD